MSLYQATIRIAIYVYTLYHITTCLSINYIYFKALTAVKEVTNMKKITTSSIVNIDDSKISTVYKTGNITEIITPHHRNECLKKIRRLSKTQYVDLETGEVKEYKQHNNRGNNIQGVQRSLATLRRIINLNFTGSNSECFLTLTYSNVMTDTNCSIKVNEGSLIIIKNI